MRLLLVNPNTSQHLTSLMATAAERVAAPGTEVVAVTATRGFPYVSSLAEADVAASIVLEIIAEHHGEVDAAIIAAFGDPGLVSARELFAKPVVGMADAAMLTACALGRRFALITFSPHLSGWFRDGVERAGLASRCASVRAVEEPFRDVDTVQEELVEPLLSAVEAAAREDGAEVAILAGAPLAGLANKLAHRLPIRTVDPVSAALLQAEALVRLGAAVLGSGADRPPAKPTIGLPPALARRIEHTD